MRKGSPWWQWLFVVGAAAPLTDFNSCAADALRGLSTELDKMAYQLDGEPTTVGQWWDSIWTSSGNQDAKKAEETDNWWKDLWD